MVFGSVLDFVKRHKKKFIFGGVTVVLIGGAYYYISNAVAEQQNRFQNFLQQEVEEERKRQELTQRLNLSFIGSQKVASTALRSLLRQTEHILNENFGDLDDLIAYLKGEKEPPAPLTAEMKKKYWEQIKVEGMCRTFAAMYSTAILYLLISVEVNIIGRYLVQQTLEEEKAVQNNEITKTTPLPKDAQQQFLRLVGHFQVHGMKKLVEIIRSHVKEDIGKVQLGEQFTAQNMYEIIENIRDKIESHLLEPPTVNSNTVINIAPNVLSGLTLPPENDKLVEDLPSSLRNLLDELRDIVESVEFSKVFREIVRSGYFVLYQKIDKIIGVRAQKQAAESEDDISAKAPALHLAHIVPRITKESKHVFHNAPDNDYLIGLEENETLKRYVYLIHCMSVEA